MCYTPVPMSQELVTAEEAVYDSYQQNWSPELDAMLSEVARGTRTFVRPRKESEKQRFLRATAEAFEIIGGVPRYAIWADQNPDKFYAICAKTIPGMITQNNINNNGPVTIISPIGRSKLDDEPIEGESTEVPSAA